MTPSQLAVVQEALDFIQADRDAFQQCSTSASGFMDGEDRQLLAEVDGLIDRLAQVIKEVTP